MIAIVDYEAGNLTSVLRAVTFLGHQAEVTKSPERILAADRVIFPGVGAAGAAMKDIKGLGLDQVLREVKDRGTPFLGICLGTQIILEFSEEDGGVPCLGLVPGSVKRFPDSLEENGDRLKVPHMGWNQVRIVRPHPVLAGVLPEHEFYFVHSYYPDPAGEHVLGVTEYGMTFTSMMAKENLIAVQFHPEKSGRPGLGILENFCTWDGGHA